MKRFRPILVIFGWLMSLPLLGQTPILTLQEVVQLALEHNHQLKASGFARDIAVNNADPGMAGLYPRLSISGNLGYANNDTRLEFAQANVDPVEVSGAQSLSYGAGIGLTYRLFDGLGNVYTLRRLQSEAEVGEIDFQMAVENTMTSTIVQYFNLARLQLQQQIDTENLSISLRRYERALLKSQSGSGSSFELSSAEVDLRNDSLQFIQTRAEWSNARRSLNTLMGQSLEYAYELEVQVNFENLPTEESLFNRLEEYNSSLRRVRSSEKALTYAKKVAGAAFVPRLDLNAGYNYNAQENEVGLLLFQQNNGLNAGVSLQWDLFNGHQNAVRNQNARWSVQQMQALKEQQLLLSKQELANALEVYKQALFAVEIARRNVKTSELNFERAKELFALGQIDNTQFREAQLNLQRSVSGRNNALFTAKVAETEVLRLSGLLLSNSDQ